MKINKKQKILFTIGMVILVFLCWLTRVLAGLLNQAKATVERRDMQIQKLNGYYCLLEHWLNMKNKGQMIEKYFEKNKYKQIAVYGMGKVGCLLCSELNKGSSVKVLYGIDRKMGDEQYTTDKKKIADNVVSVDAVVVAIVGNISNIRDELKKKYDCPVVSIEDIVYSL